MVKAQNQKMQAPLSGCDDETMPGGAVELNATAWGCST